MLVFTVQDLGFSYGANIEEGSLELRLYLLVGLGFRV